MFRHVIVWMRNPLYFWFHKLGIDGRQQVVVGCGIISVYLTIIIANTTYEMADAAFFIRGWYQLLLPG